MFKLKRAYEEPERTDGFRVLIDRLWPRGLPKEEAALDLWMKEIAPSPELRKWFGHDLEKFDEFRERYRQELADKREIVDELRRQGEDETVTLVFAARDEQHNAAVVLKELLEEGAAMEERISEQRPFEQPPGEEHPTP